MTGADAGAKGVGTSGSVNVPNALTMLRIVLVPVFAVCLILSAHGDDHPTAWRYAAAAVFAVASITDFIDGDYARRRGQVTRFGQVADPIADKALIGTALVGLSWLGELPWWVTVVVLVREIGVTVLRFWVIRIGVIPASRGGKVKTALQLLAVLLYLLPLSFTGAQGLREVVMGAAVVVTVVTGLDYVARVVRLRRTHRASDGDGVADSAAARAGETSLGSASVTESAP
jgi:CDP-diacylglycerol--glycerol-3-phosphate 3-phosphatidyltransferase